MSQPLTAKMQLSPWSDPPLKPVTGRFARDLWVLSKQIDGLGGEWGFDVFIRRAWNFHFSPLWLYEPLRNFNDAWLSVWMRQKAARMEVESEKVGGTSVSFRYWASMLNSEDGVVPMPSAGDRYMGVHSVQLIGAPTRDDLAFFTAWSGWAKGDGIGILSREYLDAHATGYIAERSWDIGPLGETTNSLFRTHSSPEFRDLWTRPRPRLQIRMKGPLKLEIYEGWSYGYACPAHLYIILLHQPRSSPVRVASCLVHHRYGKHTRATRPFTSEIVDLFVWPPYRRQRYGRILERVGSQRAQTRGTDVIRIAVWQADCAKPESQERAISFLRNRKYVIEAAEGRQRAFEGTRSLE
jgi:GNAT superfamily N-acetyltransferase